MPFVPHTEEDIREMMAVCQIDKISQLFDEIPAHLRVTPLKEMDSGLNEMQVSKLMHTRASQDGIRLNFLGAGAYEHYIPSAVWDLVGRGEYLTSYTPYQAEASQGTLQLLWEFQTMIASLMGLDVANASLYDGATALTEAVLMLVRASKKSEGGQILVPNTLSPFYRDVLLALVGRQGIGLTEVPYQVKTGTIDLKALEALTGDERRYEAVIIPQPNFFGVLEPVDAITDWAETKNIPVIGVVNPFAMTWLKPPGQWGKKGAVIACGEAQPFGIPLSSGGPYCGFLACASDYVRQMPGRLVGRTLDEKGRIGYTLTLQAREQHIRRAKATSNICTNQGLLVTAATIHMSIMGPEGLKRMAIASHQNLMLLKAKIHAAMGQTGVRPMFSGQHFHEMVFHLPKSAGPVLERLAKSGIDAGLQLSPFYPELDNCILSCVTETKDEADLDAFCDTLKIALN
ncbi:MAG: aminomethyl-transferring glycine dehydrogenase subunit GcvPA [Gammaproteobacteria bacterium]